MLPRSYRLTSDQKIDRVKSQGRQVRSNFLVIRWLAEAESLKAGLPNQSRFAIIVSRRIDKRAVVRNRLKRRLGEAVRALTGKIKPGNAILITAKPKAKNCSYRVLYQEVEGILGRAGLFKKHKLVT